MKSAYYVTFKDGNKTAWIMGPFQQHDHAVACVEFAFQTCLKLDPRVWFYAHGTAKLTIPDDQSFPLGKLTALLSRKI